MKRGYIFTAALFLVFLLGNVYAQSNKLRIIGAYNYESSANKNIRVIAIEVAGDVNLIGDPDDIEFINAENGKSTGYGVDDFSFLSPDGKEAWINLPKDFNRKMVRGVFIVGVPKEVKKIKLSYDGKDISDSALITGYYPALPPVSKRIRYK